jgi:ferrous iron transport protein B
MSMPIAERPVSGRRKTFTIAVAGNPNCGKTTLFNALTGLRHKVGNYPGVTVEKREGAVLGEPGLAMCCWAG